MNKAVATDLLEKAEEVLSRATVSPSTIYTVRNFILSHCWIQNDIAEIDWKKVERVFQVKFKGGKK